MIRRPAIILAVVAVLWLATPVEAVITCPLSVSAGSLNGNDVTTSAIDTSGSTLLVMQIASGAAISAPSDNMSNSWTPLTEQTSGVDVRGRLYYVDSPTVGAGHTFSHTGSAPAIAVLACTGTTLYDGNENASTSSTGTVQPGSVTPSQNNAVLITGYAGDGSSVSLDGGFTEVQDIAVSGPNWAVGLAYKIQTSAGAENPTWTPVDPQGFGTTAGMAAFRSDIGGAPSVAGRVLLMGVGR